MKKSSTIFDKMFYVGYLLLIISSLFKRVIFLNGIIDYIEILGCLLLALIIVVSFNKVERKTLLKIFILLIVSIISSYFSGSSLPLKFILLICAAKNVDFDRFIITDLKIKSILILLLVGLHYLGLTNDYIMLRTDGTIRNSMGFSHPNMFGLQLLIICLEFFYVKYINKQKFKIFDVVFLVFIIFVIDYFSDSRSSVIALFVFGLLYVLKDIIIKLCNKKTLRFIFTYSFVIFASLSLIAAIKYKGSEILAFVNKIISGRLYYDNYFFEKYGISLFGQHVETISTEQASLRGIRPLVLDNVYMHLLIRYGISMFCVYGILFINSISDAIKNKNSIINIILFVLLLFGIMETNIIVIEVCPFVLYFTKEIYKTKEKGGKA